ncbi:MAG: hydroxymethylbilane synthase [Thaumarchaeota archaeon]|nr:hydroxymethylbilane synthase [Nitrososphaerota archaeon]
MCQGVVTRASAGGEDARTSGGLHGGICLTRIRVGTRTSRLAMVQTEMMVSLIRANHPTADVEVIPITTLGDRLPLEKRAEVEGKGAFTEDLESLLANGTVDVGVHSMKDLPMKLGPGLAIAATPARADPRDALVSRGGSTFASLRQGATLGTSSLRRKAQLRALRGDLRVSDLHGNVDTRLRRMDELGIDGIVVAAAGLERLGRSDRITQYFDIDEIVPAPCQGTIALEAREDDQVILRLLRVLDNTEVRTVATCERSFATRLGGDCDIPVGFHASLEEKTLKLVGAVLSPDGGRAVRHVSEASASDPMAAGEDFAEELLALGGRQILEAVAD